MDKAMDGQGTGEKVGGSGASDPARVKFYYPPSSPKNAHDLTATKTQPATFPPHIRHQSSTVFGCQLERGGISTISATIIPPSLATFPDLTKLRGHLEALNGLLNPGSTYQHPQDTRALNTAPTSFMAESGALSGQVHRSSFGGEAIKLGVEFKNPTLPRSFHMEVTRC